MKLHSIVLFATAALLPAQAPAKPKPPTGKAVPASSVASNTAPASLADLERDFKEKKFAALDTYLKAHASAKDHAEAIVEAVDLATAIARPDDVLRLTDLYLKGHADGEAADAMQLSRAGALRDKGDVAGAQKVFEEVIDKAGDHVQTLVEATTALAEMLVDTGKKDQAMELLAKVGASRPSVNGLKEHFEGIAKQYEMIGAEPKALGQNDSAGKPIDLAEYKGKVLMLDFWATWCGPCVGELPNVIAAYEKFHDRGFEIVGISLDEDKAAFEKFIADHKMTWRHFFDGKGWKNEVAVAYGVESIPATYLIGTDGKIAAIGLRGDKLAKKLGELLGGDKPAARKTK